MGCGVNHPVQVYRHTASQNVRNANEYHLGDGNVTGTLFPGCLFWFPGTQVPDTDTDDCFWEAMFEWWRGDSHDNYWGWRVGGYFNEGVLREFRWAARLRHLMSSCPTTLRHTQHSWHPYGDTACGHGAFQSWLEARYSGLLAWISDRLQALGNPTQNFASRVVNNVTYFGVRVLYSASLKDINGVHERWLARNNWVWFTWGAPPVTGATLHDHIRVQAWSVSRTDPLTIGTRFIDADLNFPTGTQDWTWYNIATMPTGGPT
jgi:hypothetical protein